MREEEESGGRRRERETDFGGEGKYVLFAEIYGKTKQNKIKTNDSN